MLIKLLFLVGGAMLLARWMEARRGGGGGGVCAPAFRRGLFSMAPGRLFAIMRELHLDDTQRAQVKDILHSMRRMAGEARFARMEALEALAEAARAEKFDRGTVEGRLAQQAEAEARARRELLDKIELLHSGMTSEQKAKLQELLGGAAGERHDAPPPGNN